MTGGCGFIGANLVPRLADDGIAVRVLDNLSRGTRDNVQDPGVEVIEGDIRDEDVLAAAVADVDTVIHLAAYGSVAESVAEPRENFDVNVRGTLYVLRAAVDAGVDKLVFASTGGAIMGNTPPPVDETSLPWPISPYGASKLCGEAYCHAFAGSYGLRVVALRFANVFGPMSEHKKGAVTNFVKSALRREPITIYGDGTATRDFLYVDDLCEGIAAAVEAPLSDEVIHLASGEETSIGELARHVAALAGADDLPIRYEDRRPGEIERTFAKAERAAELLGFRPAHTLVDGLRKTVDWFAARTSERSAGGAARP